MDRTILINVNGSYIRKDNSVAGVQGEGNSTVMNIVFDESWADFTKKVTFWNSKGLNPVEVTLGANLLTDITTSLLNYSVPIPSEPLEFSGEMMFVIDGYVNGVRRRSLSDTLDVKYAPIAENAGEPTDPTPTQAEQLQAQIDTMLEGMQAERILSQNAANTATEAAETATIASNAAENAAQTAITKASEASGAAETAVKANSSAQNAANTATRAAETATNAANTATSAAQTASSAAQTATTKADEAKTSEKNAKSSEEKAVASEQNSKNSETNASISETNAKSSEEKAKKSEDSAGNSAIEAKSWAVGGTGTRAGEDINNAKFWAEQAQVIVGGDYVTTSEFEATMSGVGNAIAENRGAISNLQGQAKNYVQKEAGKGLSTNDYTNEDKTLVQKISGIETDLQNKVQKEAGKGLSTNDYTNEDKTLVQKISGIETDLQNKVQKEVGKGLSTNDYTNEDKSEVSKIAGKENKATFNLYTILASGWSAEGAYSFESEYPVASYDLEISLSENTTVEQAEAFVGALIVGNSTTNVIKALGDVPTVDIPVIVKVVAK